MYLCTINNEKTNKMTITNEIRSKVFTTAWNNYNNQDWQSVKRYGHKSFGECLKSSWSFYKNKYGKETVKMIGGTIEQETEKPFKVAGLIGINKTICLPKSQVQVISIKNDIYTFTVPTWLWNQKAA